MSRIDTAAAQAAQAGQPDRQQAEAKQRKWLFELEHALLAMGMKKPGRAQDRVAGDAPPPHVHAQGGRQPAGEQTQQAAREAAPALAATGPAVPGRQDAAPQAAAMAVSTGVAAAAAALVPPGDMTPAAPAVTAPGAAAAGHALAHTGPVLHADAAVGAGAPEIAAGGTGDRMDGPAAPSAPAVAAGLGADAKALEAMASPAALRALSAQPATASPQSAAAYAALRGNAAGGAAEGGDSLPPALQPARAGALLAAPGVGGAAQRQAPAALPESTPEAMETLPPQEAAPEQLDAEPFEKRLMHLYHGADGVQAWIRDAELNAAQARALARVLASELGGNGTRLATLTVNGRKIVTSEQAEGAAARALPDTAADTGAADAEANFIRGI